MSVESQLSCNLPLYLSNVHVIERKVKSLRMPCNAGCFLRLFYAAVTAVSAHGDKWGEKKVLQPV